MMVQLQSKPLDSHRRIGPGQRFDYRVPLSPPARIQNGQQDYRGHEEAALEERASPLAIIGGEINDRSDNPSPTSMGAKVWYGRCRERPAAGQAHQIDRPVQHGAGRAGDAERPHVHPVRAAPAPAEHEQDGTNTSRWIAQLSHIIAALSAWMATVVAPGSRRSRECWS